MNLSHRIAETLSAIRAHTDLEPDTAITLGSGLGPLAEEVEDAVAIPYSKLPFVPVSTAPGHAGRLVLGRLAGRQVVVMQGRVHPYEGYPQAEVAYLVRVMHSLGAVTYIVTNACGGLNPIFCEGDLMLHVDYLNLTGGNPLVGPNDDTRGPRFPVTFDAYAPELRELALKAARALDLNLQQGVYAGVLGPAFFSRAELRMLRTLGADAIGMSTVPEVIVARHEGMQVLGLSTVTDMALPDRDLHATADDVLEMAAKAGPRFRGLIKAVLERMNPVPG